MTNAVNLQAIDKNSIICHWQTICVIRRVE